jgi:hypothetical protein
MSLVLEGKGNYLAPGHGQQTIEHAVPYRHKKYRQLVMVANTIKAVSHTESS